ncbi:ATP-grasp domain-containing protein [Mariniblastus sp.]|nr:ATP-grasp domain-containing protein [Mariniblastus sp.]
MRAFRKSILDLKLKCEILATDIDGLAPAIQEIDRHFLICKNTDPQFIPSLLEICKNEKVSVVFPLIDPDIPILANAAEQFNAIGVRVAVVNSRAAEISADKWKTFDFFNQLNLPTPVSWLPDRPPETKPTFPFFIKPRRGSAATNTFQVRNQDELDFLKKYVPDPIIQEHLPGPEITSDIICDFDGRVLAVVSRQRIAVRGGEVVKGVTLHNPTIDQACHKIAAALPACGPITAQCMMKNGTPHFIEINARMGGGLPLGIAAGVRIPEILLQVAAGQNVTPIEPGAYEIGLQMTRFDDSFFIAMGTHG